MPDAISHKMTAGRAYFLAWRRYHSARTVARKTGQDKLNSTVNGGDANQSYAGIQRNINSAGTNAGIKPKYRE